MNDQSVKRKLVLGTWFTPYFRGFTGGGLPNEFLVSGGGELLLYDQVLCDPYALEQELVYKDQWLTPQIFGELLASKVLRPIPKSKMNAFVADQNRLLDRAGRLDELVSLMQTHLEGVEKPFAVRGASESTSLLLRAFVAPELAELNRDMLRALARAVGDSVPYGWRGRQSHWSVDQAPVDAAQLATLEQVMARVVDARSASDRLLHRVPFVPPIGPQERWALRENMAAERIHTLRWQYGDPEFSVSAYQAFRTSRRFWATDAFIDRGRESVARRNLDVLLSVRERTKDIRASIQDTVAGLLLDVDPHRTLAKMLDNELTDLVQTLLGDRGRAHRHRVAGRVALAAALTAPLLAALGEMIGAPLWATAPADAAVAAGIHATMKLSERRAARAVRRQHALSTLRLEFQNVSSWIAT